mgnify:CR=1 FL=1
MSPTRIAVSLCCEDAGQLARETALAIEQGADLVEWRLDCLADPAAAVTLLAEHPHWRGRIIATARRRDEAGPVGGFEADESARISLLEAVGLQHPGFIDLELAAYNASANIRQKIHLVCAGGEGFLQGPRSQANQLILSAHLFAAADDPALAAWVARQAAMLAQCPWAIAKIAAMPASLDQLQTILHVARQHLPSGQPRALIGMGSHGTASRIAAGRFGLALSFASLGSNAAAPGQVSLDQMLALYRANGITPQTHLYGVVGSPVAHSKSPLMHNRAFGQAQLNACYLPLHAADPPDARRLFDRLLTAPDEPWAFHGFSVTIPYKQVLLEWAGDHAPQRVLIDPRAQRIGAANTAVRTPHGVHVFNSDYHGLAGPLQTALLRHHPAASPPTAADPARDLFLSRKSVLLLGAGGTARAALCVAIDAGAEQITICNRTAARAHELREALTDHDRPRVHVADWQARNDLARAASVILNTTSIGMPHATPQAHTPTDSSPLEPGLLQPHQIVVDAVYADRPTALLADAHSAGCICVDGLDILAAQGEAQFLAFTGQTPPEPFITSLRADRPRRPSAPAG